uniref:Putative Bactoprenol glucosyl transferase n=1 Tax=mine drainage metagenome TaxID=410659 RepID=E6PD87_9ZZZZ
MNNLVDGNPPNGESAHSLPLVSVIIPAFNEEDCVDELAARLQRVSAVLGSKYEFEFIITENGSADATYGKLRAIRAEDPRFKIIRFSRNFGIEPAISAGLSNARGSAAIIMCADLQDPPELIPEFIEKWEQGFQNVYGIVSRRTDESWLRQQLTRGYYWLLNRATGSAVPRNVSDFRLIDKKLYEILNSMPERRRMLRTMWPWLGFKSVGIKYVRPARFGGKSTYQLAKNILFGLRGIASATAWPLGLIPVVGTALAGLAFLMLAGFSLRWVTKGVPFNGFGTIVAVILLMFGLLFLFLGIMAEYISIIYEEVRGRPLYVTSEEIGFLSTPEPNLSADAKERT